MKIRFHTKITRKNESIVNNIRSCIWRSFFVSINWAFIFTVCLMLVSCEECFLKVMRDVYFNSQPGWIFFELCSPFLTVNPFSQPSVSFPWVWCWSACFIGGVLYCHDDAFSSTLWPLLSLLKLSDKNLRKNFAPIMVQMFRTNFSISWKKSFQF